MKRTRIPIPAMVHKRVDKSSHVASHPSIPAFGFNGVDQMMEDSTLDNERPSKDFDSDDNDSDIERNYERESKSKRSKRTPPVMDSAMIESLSRAITNATSSSSPILPTTNGGWIAKSFAQIKQHLHATFVRLSTSDMNVAYGPMSPSLPAGLTHEVAKSREDFIEAFNRTYYELIGVYQDSNNADYLNGFAKIYNVWNKDRSKVDYIDYKTLYDSNVYLRNLLYDNFSDGIKQFNLAATVTARGHPHTYEDELIRMQRVFYLGYVMLLAQGFLQSEVDITSAVSSQYDNSEVLQTFLGGKLTIKNGKPVLAKRSAFSKILNSCFQKIRQLKLKRKEGNFMKERRVKGPNGNSYGMSYHEIHCPIEKYFDKYVPKDVDPERFHLIWGNRNLRTNVVQCLLNIEDPDLPDLVPQRGIISFRSHLYNAHTDTWWAHWDPHKPSHLVASVFIDAELDTRPIHVSVLELMKNPMTGLDQPLVELFRTQQYSDREIEIACAMLGRVLYPIGHDGREIMNFLKGVGGSGKSSLLKLLESFFDPSRIAVMGNTTEVVFGLETFIGKDLVMATDLTKTANVDAADILNMVSNDRMAIKRKNKTQESVELNCHFLAAGNQIPVNWMDVDGNFLRRLFFLDFPLKPPVDDRYFKSRLRGSGGFSYRFLNCAYLTLKHTLPDRANFWDMIPDRFITNRRNFLCQTSVLLTFMTENAHRLEYGITFYVLETDFLIQYKEWCSTYNYQPFPDGRQPLLGQRLAYMKCDTKETTKIWPPVTGKERCDRFILGLRFKMI